MKPWLIRRKLLMAQAKDLARQLQEAWDDNEALRRHFKNKCDANQCLRDQLHRVARERDECYRQHRLADIRRKKEE